MGKYRKIPPAPAANQIAENARIPPADYLQKIKYFTSPYSLNYSYNSFMDNIQMDLYICLKYSNSLLL